MTNNFIIILFNYITFGLMLYLALAPTVLGSVLTLITLATLFSIFLIGYGAVFLGILYLAIYIGAVTVFFLFVVMMTDLTYYEIKNNLNSSTAEGFLYDCYNYYLGPLVVFTLTYSFLNISTLAVAFKNTSFFRPSLALDIFQEYETNFFLVSKSIFSEHLAPFIILGIIILVTLVGSIFLTAQTHESSISNLTENVNISAYTAQIPEIGEFIFSESKSQDLDEQLVVLSKGAIRLNSSNNTLF